MQDNSLEQSLRSCLDKFTGQIQVTNSSHGMPRTASPIESSQSNQGRGCSYGRLAPMSRDHTAGPWQGHNLTT